jgi:hypothetical protein
MRTRKICNLTLKLSFFSQNATGIKLTVDCDRDIYQKFALG